MRSSKHTSKETEAKKSSPLLSIFTPSERNVFSSIAFFSGFFTFTFVHKKNPSEKRVTVSFYDGVRNEDNMEIVFYTAKNREPLHHRHDLSQRDITDLLEGFSLGVVPFFFRSRYGEIEGFEWDDFIFREDLAQFYFYAENAGQEVVRLHARRVIGGGTKAFVFEKLYYKVSEGEEGPVPFESRSTAYIEDFPVKIIAQFFLQLGENGRETLGLPATRSEVPAIGQRPDFFNEQNKKLPTDFHF